MEISRRKMEKYLQNFNSEVLSLHQFACSEFKSETLCENEKPENHFILPHSKQYELIALS